MKQLRTICLIFGLSLILLSACQSNNPTESAETSIELTEAYPIEDSDQIGEISADSALAYPVPEENLAFLTGTWKLASKLVDGVEQASGEKTLTLNADGTYEINSTDGIFSGFWTNRVNAMEAVLIFDLGTESAAEYNIIEITDGMLSLTTQQNGSEISEQYVPID